MESEYKTIESAINYEYITAFVRGATPSHVGLLGQIEKYAYENGIPVVQPEVARFLEIICLMKKPKRILEIGTAIGFSALVMYFASDNPSIKTIDRYPLMIEMAEKNFMLANAKNDIQIIKGDAGDVLKVLEGPFDLIFLDASKGQYPEFLPHCVRLLDEGGLFICDNVLHKGMTAGDRSLAPRRQRTIVKRLKIFVEEIMNHPQLHCALLPFGDGITVSIKQKIDTSIIPAEVNDEKA